MNGDADRIVDCSSRSGVGESGASEAECVPALDRPLGFVGDDLVDPPERLFGCEEGVVLEDRAPLVGVAVELPG